MSKHHHRHRRSKWLSLYIWHRYMGLVSALIIILVAATGVLLNHTEGLQLTQQFTTNRLLLNQYGIKADKPVSFKAGKYWISLSGDTLYLGQQPLDISQANLLGAVLLDSIIITTSHTRLNLLTIEGELIESLPVTKQLSGPIQRIGMNQSGQLVIESKQQQFTLDATLSHINPTKHMEEVHWSNALATPADLRQQLTAKQFSKALPWERVILDLHSGRLFGNWGVYFFDAAAIIFTLLALSGLSIWIKQLIKSQQHKKNRPR